MASRWCATAAISPRRPLLCIDSTIVQDASSPTPDDAILDYSRVTTERLEVQVVVLEMERIGRPRACWL
jgi:hypothetical protein